jgi:hypothetical protein
VLIWVRYVNAVAVDNEVMLRRKAYALAKQLRLDRDDRIEFARMLLWRDLDSWKDLTLPEILRLLDALEGYPLIHYIVTGCTPPLPQPARSR